MWKAFHVVGREADDIEELPDPVANLRLAEIEMNP
jgi:hypothetical protein